MDMPVRLLEAHPLAEEIRNQVVVKRGPLVYCLESMDMRGGGSIDNVLIPADIKLIPKKVTIEGSPVVALEGKARLISSNSWEGILYRPVSFAGKTVDIRLIPYYAWGIEERRNDCLDASREINIDTRRPRIYNQILCRIEESY